MDVVALYPSIDVDFAVDRCMELVQEDNMVFDNVDIDELGLFLAIEGDREGKTTSFNTVRPETT